MSDDRRAERPLACARVLPLLPMFVGDDLEAADARDLRAHLRGCAACRAQASAHLQALRALRRVADPVAVGPAAIRIDDAFFATLHGEVMVAVTRAAEPRSPAAATGGLLSGARARHSLFAAAASLLFVAGVAMTGAFAERGGLSGRPAVAIERVGGQMIPVGSAGLRPLGHEDGSDDAGNVHTLEQQFVLPMRQTWSQRRVRGEPFPGAVLTPAGAADAARPQTKSERARATSDAGSHR